MNMTQIFKPKAPTPIVSIDGVTGTVTYKTNNVENTENLGVTTETVSTVTEIPKLASVTVDNHGIFVPVEKDPQYLRRLFTKEEFLQIIKCYKDEIKEILLNDDEK